MKKNTNGAAQIKTTSEEEAKKVREKNERTYLKSSLAGGIVKGTVTRFIKSGSPKMINKLRNIGK